MTPADIKEIGLDGWRLVRTIPDRSPRSPAGTEPEALTVFGRRGSRIDGTERVIDTVQQ